MKDQNRNHQRESHSAGRQGHEGQQGHQQAGRHDSGPWPGTSRSHNGGGESKEGRRNTTFVPLDKDDVY